MEPQRDEDDRPSARNWDEDTDLWEHQGQPLTVERLRFALSHADDDLPVLVTVYDETERREAIAPVEVGFTGKGDRPRAVVITATRLAAR